MTALQCALELNEACRSNNMAIVRRLVGERASTVNEPIANGVTALHVAVEEKNLDLIKFLLSKGADRTKRYEDSRDTVVHVAAAANRADIVEMLLKNDDGSWNMDGAYCSGTQNARMRNPEPPDNYTDASDKIKEMLKDIAPTAKEARKERARMAFQGAHVKYIEGCSSALCGTL